VKALGERYGGLDDSAVLKRIPRGFSEEHPAASWLKYQSFTAGRMLKDSDVTNQRHPTTLPSDLESLFPLVRRLNGALGYR
jgi:uncharacterized protein (DUF2461 family)